MRRTVAEFLDNGEPPATVVLVEGASDQVAVETLAERLEIGLQQERVAVLALNGATNISTALHQLLELHPRVRLAGLCDEAEQGVFARALERNGLGVASDRTALELFGFFVCVEDLEDEMIRALGVEAIESVVAEQGELGSFRIMQNQPQWRAQPADRQLRRFFGSRSMRKIRYGALLAATLDLRAIPEPLDGLMERIRTG